MLLNQAPKFGKDDDYVDQLAAQVWRDFAQEITRHMPPSGGYFGPRTRSVSADMPHGERVGARPDCRQAKAPLADNAAPSPGADRHIPRAVLK